MNEANLKTPAQQADFTAKTTWGSAPIPGASTPADFDPKTDDKTAQESRNFASSTIRLNTGHRTKRHASFAKPGVLSIAQACAELNAALDEIEYCAGR